jgi:hypothetical protein
MAEEGDLSEKGDSPGQRFLLGRSSHSDLPIEFFGTMMKAGSLELQTYYTTEQNSPRHGAETPLSKEYTNALF